MFDRKLFTTLARDAELSAAYAPPVFPMPVLDGQSPVMLVFDQHDRGVEIAYERDPTPRDTPRVRLASRETALYRIPRFVPVFAAGDGRIVYARKHLDGHTMLVEHRGGFLSYYGRLEHMFATPSDRRPQREARVAAGDILGYATASIATTLRPLRFELWRCNREQDYETIDPLRFVHRWRLLRWSQTRAKPRPPSQPAAT